MTTITTPPPPGTKVCRLACGTCIEAWIAARRTADDTGTPLIPPGCPDQHPIGWVQPYDVEFSLGTFPVKWASSGLWTRESPSDVRIVSGDGRPEPWQPEEDIPTPRTASAISL